LASRDAEIINATQEDGWNKIDPKGIAAQEIIDILNLKRMMHPKQLSTLAEINFKALKNYLIRLEKEKLIKVQLVQTRNKGKRQIVELVR